MGYRGEDLDLRTPQTWSATPADLAGWTQAETNAMRGRPGSYALPRGGPIWVDETVLACCNHAFDQALLNRASEVRLEHLLHALTRIDAAAELLEARGVRVAGLRRDSATVIASEIPIGLPNGKGVPRRSDLFEDVLRLAAGAASRRNAPASIEDLLHVIMDQEPNLPGLALLARNTARFAAAAEPLPPLTRTVYVTEPRVSEFQEQSRPRMPPAETYYAPETPRVRSVHMGTPTDSIQNSRLDALEQMVRALGIDLANERKVVSGLLQEVQRDLGSQRDDTSRLGGGLHERLQSFDTGFEKRLSELGRTWSILSDRLQGLESAVLNNKPAGTADMGPLGERIGQLERAVQASLGEGSRSAQMLGERVKAVETLIQTRPVTTPGGTNDLAPLASRLEIIEEAVLSRETTTRDMADGLRRLEEASTAERTRAREAYDRLTSELGSLAGTIDRLNRDETAAILRPLNTRLEGLAGVIEGRHSETAQGISGLALNVAGIGERLLAAERSAGEQALRFAEQQRASAQELSEVHDALMKLNSNQHTLAGSIDQWRQDGASMISLLGTRMEGVERETAKPLALLETMGGTIDKMHKVTVERYQRRHRLWYWLFGTDDWIAASWPTPVPGNGVEAKSIRSIWKR